MTDDLIADNYRTDGVVVLADSAAGPRTLDKQFEAVSQVAMADLIVITKTDLVSPNECDQFETRLQEINGSARRVRADHGCVPIYTLFGLSAMRPSATVNEVADWLGTHAQHGHDGHSHHRIASASIEVAEPIQSCVFDSWLDTLLALKGPDILRMKGIVHVEGMDWPFVFHGVQHIFDAPVPLTSWSGNNTTSRVVLIARGMDKSELEASLEILLGRMTEAEVSGDEKALETTEMPF